MDPGPVRDVLTLVVGIGTGVLSAAFGVGGAVVSTPAIRLLGVGALTAVGTTLPSVLPSAISGTLRYSREGLVEWRVVALTVPVGIAAAVAGAMLTRVVPGEGHVLMVLTALLLGTNAWRMARRPAEAAPAETASPQWPRPEGESRDRAVLEPPHTGRAMLIAVGVVAGLLSGLLGIGGGVVMVPGFVELCKIPLKTAIATSLACVGLFAVPGTITHAALGGIDWRVAIALAVGVVPGARLGAAAAIRATDFALRRAVAGFLALISLLYFGGEVAALFG